MYNTYIYLLYMCIYIVNAIMAFKFELVEKEQNQIETKGMIEI